MVLLPPGRSALRFPTGLAAYGTTRDMPPWLADGRLRIREVVHDFGAGNGINGAGVHIGDGLVLTAWHVIASHTQSMRPALAGDVPFVGDRQYDHHWWLQYLPPRSSYTGDRHPRMSPTAHGKWHDFAIVRTPTKRGHQAVPGVRATGTLADGERVWIVGRCLGTTTQVSQGAFARLDGDNAIIGATKVESGFSGSPVLDDAGRLVGLTVVLLGTGDAYIVRTETIARLLDAHAPHTLAAAKLVPALD